MHSTSNRFKIMNTKSVRKIITIPTNNIKRMRCINYFMHHPFFFYLDNEITFFIDDNKYHTFVNNKSGYKAWPFDKEFYLVLNIAVGGNWGGKFGIDESIFPQRMEVEYVRVYQ